MEFSAFQVLDFKAAIAILTFRQDFSISFAPFHRPSTIIKSTPLPEIRQKIWKLELDSHPARLVELFIEGVPRPNNQEAGTYQLDASDPLRGSCTQ